MKQHWKLPCAYSFLKAEDMTRDWTLFLDFLHRLHRLFFITLSKLMFFLKVAPRVEKTEVFRKVWNFANWTYFASYIMRKHYFLLWTKETAFFSYFYFGIIFYSAELFDYPVNFKFYLNIFILLNINTNQTSTEQYLN